MTPSNGSRVPDRRRERERARAYVMAGVPVYVTPGEPEGLKSPGFAAFLRDQFRLGPQWVRQAAEQAELEKQDSLQKLANGRMALKLKKW